MEMEPIRCAAHVFTFDEEAAVPLDQFFSRYKDQFPMLAVIVDGHYGDTIYDCFENFQVFRIEGYTTQERVVCQDSKSAHATVDTYYSLPLRSIHGFQKIKGHTSLGPVQSLEVIVTESSLPVMVKLASEGDRDMRLGWKTTRDLGNLLCMARYQDHYMMINNIDTKEIVMNSTSCLMALSTQLTATPITGFKYKSRDEYLAYVRKLDHQVATSGEVYDKTRGNPAFVMYEHVKELPETIHRLIFGPSSTDNDDGDGDYEVVDNVVKPTVPPKKSLVCPPASSSTPTSTKDGKNVPKQQKQGAVSKLLSKFHKQKAAETSQEADNNSAESTPGSTVGGTAHPDHETTTAHGEAPPVHRKPKPVKGNLTGVVGPPPVPNKPKVSERTTAPCVEEKKPDKPYENRALPNAVVRPSMRSAPIPPLAEDRKPHPLPQTTTKPIEPIDDTYGSEYSEPIEYEELRKQSPDRPQDDIEGEEIYDYYPPDADDVTNPANTEDFSSRKDTKVSIKPERIHTNPNLATDDKIAEREESAEPDQFNIAGLSISDVAGALKTLRLDKHAAMFAENQVDGEILSELSVEDMVHELGMKKLEAIRLRKYVQTGHVPN